MANSIFHFDPEKDPKLCEVIGRLGLDAYVVFAGFTVLAGLSKEDLTSDAEWFPVPANVTDEKIASSAKDVLRVEISEAEVRRMRECLVEDGVLRCEPCGEGYKVWVRRSDAAINAMASVRLARAADELGALDRYTDQQSERLQ